MRSQKWRNFLPFPSPKALVVGALSLVGLALFAWLVVRFVVPNVVGSGEAYLEVRAVSSLRNLHWAEGTFRKGNYADVDGDGVGEFGTVLQLAAKEPLPGGALLPAPLLPPSATTGKAGLLVKDGYCFSVVLPSSPDDRERRFVAYAWPERAAGSGTRTFCVDQDETIREAPAGLFLDCDKPPPADACGPGSAWKRWRNKTSVNPVGAQ